MHVLLTGPATPSTLVDLLGPRVPSMVPAGLGGTPVNALCRALLDEGHRVTLVTVSPEVAAPAELSGDGLDVICVPWRSGARERATDLFRAERRWLTGAIADSPADVVHAHWTYEYALAALAAGRPTLVTVHDAPVTILRHHTDAYRLVRLAMAARVRMARPQLSAVSPYAAGRWQREMLDRRSVAVVPNIAPAAPPPDPASPARILSVGTAAPLKNVWTGIEAFTLAAARYPGLQLRLVGPGLDGGSELAEATRSRFPGSAVEFLGPLPPGRVLSELSRASVLMHPSLEETQGMAVIEAMRCGVPVVAGRRSGGVPWTLDDGRAGLLVDVTDPSAIAGALVRLLTDDVGRQRLVDRARAVAQERYSPGAVATAYLRLYERLG